ncbi:nucleotide-diphospho-sugar transferase [Neocallimastix lanati (nom. inval.)]|nr:nucleotide-diphospho-sugar transferase [Neocallimastix sp. JGI-2020a]
MNEELYVVNLKKERVTGYLNDINIYKNLPVYLDHFYSKSTEEYIKRKYKKTSAAHGELSTWNFNLKSVKKRYFKNNKITKEKLNLFNKYKKELDERFKLKDFKYCLCTILNDKFVIGFETMLYSFYKYNNWFNGDILVMHDDNYSILSDESKKEILLKFPNIKFLKIDNSKYNELNFNFIKKKFIPNLIKFEIFGLTNYDKVLYIDSDTLVISNIYELFNRDEDLICFTNESHLVNDIEIWNNIFDGSRNTNINNGVIFINKNMLNKTHVDGMLNLAYKYDELFPYYNGCPDQDIMQDYFIENNIEVTLGPNTYNTIEKVFYGNNKKISDEKIIHYIINKPWNSNEPGYEYISNIWHIYHDEYKELYKLKKEWSNNRKLLLNCKKRCPNENRKFKKFCKKCISLDMLDEYKIL